MDTNNKCLKPIFLSLLYLLMLCSNSAYAAVDTVEVSFGEPGQEQMPVIYVHGWNDDGTGWGRGTPHATPCAGPTESKIPSPSSFLADVGITNWAVQWWSTNQGAPDSTSEEGYAFLVTAEELIEQSNWLDDNAYSAQNRPCPSIVHSLFSTLPTTLPSLVIKNTYNDSGSVADHARDLQALINFELNAGSKFGNASQINIVTHSKGSLVTRSMLSMSAEPGNDGYETVANAIYNAPPFTGSSTADLLARFYQLDDLTLAAILNDPYFIAALGDDPDAGMRGVFIAYINLLFGFMGYEQDGVDVAEALLPPGVLQTALALIDRFSLQSMREFLTNESILPNEIAEQNLIDLEFRILLLLIKNTGTSMLGYPAQPGLADLTITRSVERLLARPTADFAAQFVIGGDWNGPSSRNSIFPCDLIAFPPTAIPLRILPTDCVNSIEDDPATLYNVGLLENLIPRKSDGAVSTGSAFLLTETARFGEQMKRLDVVDADHGSLTDPRVVGEKWLAVLLSPITNMILSGSISVADEAGRRYIVSSTSRFHFVSQSVSVEAFPASTVDVDAGSGVTVTVNAARHEYRVITRDAGANTNNIGEWQSLTPGGSVNFSDLDDKYDLGNRYFHLQWRSVNDAGAKEMIRHALIAIDTDVPQIVEESIFGPFQNQVYERKSLFTPVMFNLNRDTVAAATQDLQAKWVVSNPLDKAVNFVFDKRANFTYRWNDVDLDAAGADTITDAAGVLLPLSTLGDGLHTLYYRLSSLTTQGSIRSVKIFIDNTPPEIDISCSGAQSFRCFVGPNTPLQFTVVDAQSGGGSGGIAIESYPGGLIPPRRQFTLGETDLAALGEAAGTSGALVPLQVNATDRVGNESSETLEVYYDWTAPKVSIENIDAIPVDDGYRAFENKVTIEVSVDSENGGLNVPVAQIVPLSGTVMTNNDFVLNGSGNYESSIYLQPGKNKIIISSADIVGNLGSSEVVVDYNPAQFDQVPLTLLSQRIQDECFNQAGEEVICNDGNIDMIESDYYGNVVAFRSRSNRLVANDTNNELDIFVWRDGVLSRGNTAADGSQAIGGDSWTRAVSGNGRYLYFSSVATNLIDNTSNGNLYVKDLSTGELAVISRHFDGSPINRFAEQFEASVTFNGRYVFFSSRKANYVEGLINDDNVRGIYLVDLDPDNNGSLFDDNYETYAISNVTTSQMANGDSHRLSISSDGRYLAFRTAATDLHADLATNGATRDVLLFKFQGNADDGTLDTSVSNRVIVPIALDADYPKVGPDDDTVAFTTSVNLLAEDDNSEATATDIYLSLGEGSGSGNVSNRSLELVSLGFDGSASSSLNGIPLQDLSIANEPGLAGFGKKVAWVSAHSNIVAGDVNGVEDLFVSRNSALFPAGLAVPNWIASDLPSSATVASGALSPDGRYAYWSSTQAYVSPYDNAEMHLFRRRIEPLRDTKLSLSLIGNGRIERATVGQAAAQDNVFIYNDEDRVRLVAVADTGWLFDRWEGADSQSDNAASVNMVSDKAVTAVFTQASPPFDASAAITTNEDQRSAGVLPVFSDNDVNDTHVFSILEQAANGVASVQSNRLVYTPNSNFNGEDSFVFQITDRSGLTVSGGVVASVNVLPVNDAPLSTDLTIETDMNTSSAAVRPNIVDVDIADTFTLALVVSAQNGSVSIAGETVLYTPNTDFTGNDSFSYSVTDSGGLSVNGVATVVVNEISVTTPPDEVEDIVVSDKAPAEASPAANNKRSVFGSLTYEVFFLCLYLLVFLLGRRFLKHG